MEIRWWLYLEPFIPGPLSFTVDFQVAWNRTDNLLRLTYFLLKKDRDKMSEGIGQWRQHTRKPIRNDFTS